MEFPKQDPEAAMSRNETQEIIELKEAFAEILKKPEEKSYLKKLERLAGALVLAGISVFALTQKEAVAPEVTKEYAIIVAGKDLEAIAKGNMELFKRVDKALEEKGGIEVSPQLETTYKVLPHIVRMLAMGKVANGEIPYFSKPEIILGKEFIANNPMEAQTYMEKINKAMRATVMIFIDTQSKSGAFPNGSGVIINTENSKAILTNAHVGKEIGKIFTVGTINGKINLARVAYLEKTCDLAVLEIQDAEGSLEFYQDTEVLDIDGSPEESFKYDEKIAAIGHPIGFLYEVATSKLGGVDQYKHKTSNFKTLIHSSDPRFEKLAKYPTPFFRRSMPKGQTLHGMSGGPVIALEREGQAKLIGLNTFIDSNENITGTGLFKKFAPNLQGGINGAVSAEEIRGFLKNYEKVKTLTPVLLGEVY